MMSETASACARSILPFKNALSENSPGFAGLMPRLNSISSILFGTRYPPCEWISTTSSPVYELGDLINTHRTSSAMSSVRGIDYVSVIQAVRLQRPPSDVSPSGSENELRYLGGFWPADPDDGYAAAAGRCGDSGDRVFVRY